MSAVVTITGADGVHRMLRDYMEPKLPKRLQDATKDGGNVFKEPLKAEARKVSKRMARAVSVRRAAKDRPATVVTFRPKVAWFRHFVIGGTKDHGPRKARMLAFVPKGAAGPVYAKRVRGVPPNPMIERVADRHERQALDALDRSLDRTETK